MQTTSGRQPLPLRTRLSTEALVTEFIAYDPQPAALISDEQSLVGFRARGKNDRIRPDPCAVTEIARTREAARESFC